MTYPSIPPPPITGKRDVDEANARSYLATIRRSREKPPRPPPGQGDELLAVALLYGMLF